MPLRVTHSQRRPNPTDFSIERLFDDIRDSLPARFHARKAVCRFRSRGLLPRLYNLLEASVRQGDVNHITGDVHYLALLLRKRRTVLTIHDCGSLERLDGWRRLAFRLLWLELPLRRARVVTTISSASLISLRALIKNNVAVGAWSVIGAGSAVVRDIPDGVVAYGVPARIVRPSEVPRSTSTVSSRSR